MHQMMPASPDVDAFLLACAQAAADVPAASYMDWAFDALGGVLRFETACWGIGTHEPPTTHAVHLRGLPPALLLAYEAGIAPIDFNRITAAATPGRTINDDDVRDAFPDVMPRIKESICIPFGIANSLTTSLPQGAGSPLHHLILVWRSRPDDVFSEGERQTMQRCAPHMVAGLRLAQALDLARAGARPDAGQALVDGRGALHSFDAAFVKVVRSAFPDWAEPVLPAPLAAMLAGGPAPDGLAVDIANEGLLQRICVRQQAALPLTPAQLRVVRLYSDGLSHRAIAEQLGLAPATVRNHVAMAFRRLGVDSKLALARRLAGD